MTGAAMNDLSRGQCEALARHLLGEPDASRSTHDILVFEGFFVSPAKATYLDRKARKVGSIYDLVGAIRGIPTRDAQVEYLAKWIREHSPNQMPLNDGGEG